MLFPELSITGYSCEDLFFTRPLLDAARDALASLVRATSGIAGGARRRRAVAARRWSIAQLRVRRRARPSARRGAEVVRSRTTASSTRSAGSCPARLRTSPSTTTCSARSRSRTNQLFEVGETPLRDRDLRRPVGARSDRQSACAGRRRSDPQSVGEHRSRSAKPTIGAISSGWRAASASADICSRRAGRRESTKDVVFGGHLIAAENGQLLGESARFALDGNRLVADFDREKLRHDRAVNNTFAAGRAAARLSRHRHRCHAGADRDAARAATRGTRSCPPTNTSSTRARRKFCRFRRPVSRGARWPRAPKRLSSDYRADSIRRSRSSSASMRSPSAIATPATLHALTMPGPGTSARHADVGARAREGRRRNARRDSDRRRGDAAPRRSRSSGRPPRRRVRKRAGARTHAAVVQLREQGAAASSSAPAICRSSRSAGARSTATTWRTTTSTRACRRR